MASPPNRQFETLFGRTREQGEQFNTLDPPADGAFYGFLAKADLNEETKKWDVTFEVVNAGWMENVVFGRSVSISAPLPTAPALIYHVREADETALLKELGLPSAAYLAEGSWYALTLAQGPGGQVTGDLYDPNIDAPGGKSPSQAP